MAPAIPTQPGATPPSNCTCVGAQPGCNPMPGAHTTLVNRPSPPHIWPACHANRCQNQGQLTHQQLKQDQQDQQAHKAHSKKLLAHKVAAQADTWPTPAATQSMPIAAAAHQPPKHLPAGWRIHDQDTAPTTPPQARHKACMRAVMAGNHCVPTSLPGNSLPHPNHAQRLPQRNCPPLHRSCMCATHPQQPKQPRALQQHGRAQCVEQAAV
jgi:hypothetical protein